MLFGSTKFNPQSRFIEEIPDKLLNKCGVSENRSFGGSSFGMGSKAETRTYIGNTRPAAPSSASRGFSSSAFSAPSKNTTVFNIGDTVIHKAYGEGIVLSAKPMGNDTLIEVAFTNAGTKKIMANYSKLEKK